MMQLSAKEGISSPWRQHTTPVGLLRYSSLFARYYLCPLCFKQLGLRSPWWKSADLP